ncbi:cell agglutination protein Mam3 [Tilletia horrida]|nr:cell agglutination protein Mam3 [Tilletia horrida]
MSTSVPIAAASAARNALVSSSRRQPASMLHPALRIAVLGILTLSSLLKPIFASPLLFGSSSSSSSTSASFADIASHPHHDDEDLPRTPLKLTLDILSIAGLVLLGGVFAGLTLGLMGLDPINLQVLSTSGSPKEQKNALKVLRLLERGRHWVLVVLLLGNVIVNETLPVFLSDFGGGIAAVLSSTVLIVIFGEIVPQSICARHGLAIGAFCAPMVHATMIILAPVAYPTAKLLDYCLGEEHGTTYRKAELKTLVSLHAQLGTEHLNEDEVTIIRAVLDLNDKTVEDVMTPIDDVWTLGHDEILNEAMINKIINAGYSRIPIHEPGQPDAILGMLLVKKLISYDPEDALPVSYFHLTPLPEATPDLNCFDALTYFRSGRSHLLLISETPGEAGGAIGIVTLEDVVEELLGGEIIDETDYYVDVHTRTRVIRPRGREDSRGGGAVGDETTHIQPLIRGIIERRRKVGGGQTPFRKSFGLPTTSSKDKESISSPRAFIPTSAPGFPRSDTMPNTTSEEHQPLLDRGASGKYGAVGSMTPGIMSRAASRAKPINPKVPLRQRPGSPTSNAGSSYASELNGGFALPGAAMEDSVTSLPPVTGTGTGQAANGVSSNHTTPAKKHTWIEAALSQAAATGTRNLSRSRTIEDAMISNGGGVAGRGRFTRRSIPDDLSGAGTGGQRWSARAHSVDSQFHSESESGVINPDANAASYAAVAAGSGTTTGAGSTQTTTPARSASGGSGVLNVVPSPGTNTIETPGSSGVPVVSNLSTLSENPRAEEQAAAADANAGSAAQQQTPDQALLSPRLRSGSQGAGARGPKVVISQDKIAAVEAAVKAHRERGETAGTTASAEAKEGGLEDEGSSGRPENSRFDPSRRGSEDTDRTPRNVGKDQGSTSSPRPQQQEDPHEAKGETSESKGTS